MNLAVSEVSHANLQAYQRLQLSLILGLRRQLWIATCDDVQLRDRLAEQLHKDIQLPRQPSLLVSLELNLENPAFLNQIAQWLKQHPDFQQQKVPLTFQILGIEGLTRHPASQRRFEKHLQAMSRHLPQLNVNLLLWLSRPWANKIQQSVSEFWRWRTGVFAFSAEVTVPPHLRSAMDVLKHSIQVPERVEWDEGEGVASSRSLFPGEGAFPLIRILDSPPRESADEEEIWQENAAGVNVPQLAQQNGNGTATDSLILRSFAELEQLEAQQALSPEALAAAYLELGAFYRDAIAQGNDDSRGAEYGDSVL